MDQAGSGGAMSAPVLLMSQPEMDLFALAALVEQVEPGKYAFTPRGRYFIASWVHLILGRGTQPLTPLDQLINPTDEGDSP
jgi:hypothetical protein